ncbi:MAG: hypothetical protein ACUVTL_04515 [Thermoproteota archaeon]
MGKENPEAYPSGEFPHRSLYTGSFLGQSLTMESGAHTVHNIYYHLAWILKYRRGKGSTWGKGRRTDGTGDPPHR